MDRFNYISLKTIAALQLKKQLRSILGYLDARHRKTSTERNQHMSIDINYEGRVHVHQGAYQGWNGLKVGHCVDYVTKEWMCLVMFYDEGDTYSIPFECVERADLAGRI
jgi:hypothetical protein